MKTYLLEWFWEYCEITQIHGLNFVRYSKGKLLQVGLWTLCVLVLVFLCAYYTIALCLYYIGQPTAITSQTTSNSSNFLFPQPATCVELNFPLYLATTLGDVDAPTFDQILEHLTQSGQLASLQNQSIADTSVLNPAFVAAAYAMLALIMDYDRAQRVSTLVLNESLPGVLPLINKLQAYIEANGIDYRFLAKVVGTFVCRTMQISFATNNFIMNPQCPTLDSIVWLGAPGYLPNSHVLCANFGNSSFFDDVNALVYVTAMPQLIYGGSTAPLPGLNLYFDPHGGQSVRDASQFDALTATGFGTAAYGGLEASGQYIWLNRTVAPCGDVDQFTCAEKTLFAQIVANRSCSSLMDFLTSNSTAPPCTSRYNVPEASESTNTSLDVWTSIFDACAPQCEYTRFTSMNYPIGGTPNNGTVIYVYPYPVLFFTNTEYYLMDFEGFLNAFGGLIGWWLGGSLLAVVHIVTFTIKHIYTRLSCKAKRACQNHRSVGSFLLDIPIVKHCREYSYITDFHGFPFLSTETSLFPALLWFILLPICIAFTIQESALLISTYLAQPVETDIFIRTNATNPFEEAAACVALYRSPLAARNQSSSIVDFNQTLQNFIISGQMEFLRNIEENITISTKVLAGLDERVMLMAYMMISAFADFDQNAPWSTAGAYSQEVLDEVDLLAFVLERNNVDFFQLAKLTAAYVCDIVYQMRIFEHQFASVTSSFGTTLFNPCHDLGKFTRMTGNPVCTNVEYCSVVDFLCVSLPPNLTSFTTPQDYITTQIVNDASIDYVSFDLRHGLGSFDPANFDGAMSAFSSTTTSGFVVAGAFVALSESRQLNRSTAPCEEEMQTDCALRCYLANVNVSRGCWSLSDFSLANKPPAMPACLQRFNYSFAEAMTANASFRSLTLAECRENVCSPACVSRSYFFYTWSVGTPIDNVIQLEIHQDAFVYAVFESKLQMDITAVFSAFGAILGLWIGGSIIAIIHLPVFVISALIVRFYCPKSREQKLDWFLDHHSLRHDV